jgi:hypothetical protein
MPHAINGVNNKNTLEICIKQVFEIIHAIKKRIVSLDKYETPSSH